MCKIIKKLICLAIIGLMLFIGITIWGRGGDKFRWIGEKSGGIVKKSADILADKADEYKESVMSFFKRTKDRIVRDESVEKGKNGERTDKGRRP